MPGLESRRLFFAERPAPGAWADERLLDSLGFTGEILTLGGAGERVCALLGPGRRVTALQPSPGGAAWIALVRACAALEPEERMQVLGWLPGGRRVLLYHRLRGALDADSRAYWDAREAWIREGLYRSAAIERFRGLTRRRPAWAAIGRLLDEPDAAVRAAAPRPSSDRLFSIAARLTFGAGFLRRLDAALLALGPEAFAVGWLARGALRAPRRPLLDPGLSARLQGSTLEVLVADPLGWMRQSARRFDGVDLGLIAGDPSEFLEAARRITRPGAPICWWGEGVDGAVTLREPCPWMPDLRHLPR